MTHDRTRRPTTTHRRPARRGSVLILVVGVLVLLAISAAVYVGVGRNERLAASASERRSNRDAVAAKVFDYLGARLVADLFGNDGGLRDPSDPDSLGPFPFEDKIEPLGFGGTADPLVVGERWDYPYTRPGNAFEFSVLADPWLRDLEPTDSDGDGEWDCWRHISNVHPQGRFIHLGRMFTQRNGFYGDLFIPGAEPYELDTFTNNFGSGSDPFDYRVLIHELVNETGGNRPFPTWADRQYGADTDGDGRVDARWTELPDVYGLPKEMRFFVAVSIVDSSAMFNVNANFELGLSTGGDVTKIGHGRYPSDVDFYTALWDTYRALGGGPNEIGFINGLGVAGGPLGYREHLFRTGINAAFMDGNVYSPFIRMNRDDREEFWRQFARNPHRHSSLEVNGQATAFRPYGPEDEIELRANLFTSNDGATSRLEQNFAGLNFDLTDSDTWLNPFRDRAGNELDYADGQPEIGDIFNPGNFNITDGGNGDYFELANHDVRHLTATYNGSVPARPYNRGYIAGDQPNALPSLNQLLEDNDLQSIVGALMWALAPFGVDRGEVDTNGDAGDSFLNIYGSDVYWTPPTNNTVLHYGGQNAGYAFHKAAQLAVNARDYYDEDDDPTARTVSFVQQPFDLTDPDRGGRDLIGEFAHGRVPAAMPGASGTDQAGAAVTVVGLEHQPFIREVSTVVAYSADREELKLLAIELGNPWPEDIDLANFELHLVNMMTDSTGESFDLTGTLPAGKNIVFFVANDQQDPIGVDLWTTQIATRDATAPAPVRLGSNTDDLNFDPPAGPADRPVFELWSQDVRYGNVIGREVLVDRFALHDNHWNNPNVVFPNYPPGGDEYNPPPPGDPVNNTTWEVFTASLRRYSGGPNQQSTTVNAGFPGYVVHTPSAIALNGSDNDSHVHEVPLPGTDYPADLFSGRLTSDYLNDTDDMKGYDFLVVPDYAPFQMHVANAKDLRSPVDLLLVSSVGHLILDQPTGPGVDPPFTNPDRYVVLSETIGDEELTEALLERWDRTGGTQPPVEVLEIVQPARFTPPSGFDQYYPPDFVYALDDSGVDTPNPFVGKLDFTRFIPTQGSSALPFEALPLAARVLDAFETVEPDPSTSLMQGRVNINTAALRVLQALPFLNPRFDAGFTTGGGGIPSRDAANLLIAESLKAYRDRETVSGNLDWRAGTRAQVSGLIAGGGSTGLRDDATSLNLGGDEAPGFTSLGELLLATKWLAAGSNTPFEIDPSVPLEESLYRTGYENPGQNLSYDPLNPNPDATTDTPNYDPSNDVGEQIALVRAIRNCVSVRSDVYVAYVTIAGFSPADVARAAELGNGDVDESLAYLRASMEQRYMVVFDRSNVVKPTDRPRVLFAVQEVPTR